jgi:hypothetical protein
MAADATAKRLTALIGSVALLASVHAASSDTRSGPVAPQLASAPYTLTLSDDRSRVDLRGRIDFGVTAELRALLEHEPEVRTLRLQSPGGRIAEARGLVTVVWRYALATAARGDCASACTLVFIAGHRRELAPQARLGFHGYALRSPVFGMLDPAAEMARDRVIFRAGGVDAAFLDRAMAVPHQTMWFPDRDDLIAAGVIDRP